MNIGAKIRLLRNGGYNENIFKNFKEDINIQNKVMVQGSSFIGTIIMTCLALSTFFVSAVSRVRPLYVCSAVGFLVIYIIVKNISDDQKNITLICNYAFLCVAYAFAIALDVVQNNQTATTICVLLVALPLLIVDKPFREMIFFCIGAIVFIFETLFIKQSSKSSIDVLNAISFLVIGVFVGYQHDKMMLRNIINKRLLENQRDTDTLTALYNKGAMEDKVVDFLSGTDVAASMMVIDLDNFKYINDTFGHQEGDQILVSIGQILLSLFRSSDLISRFGGDEFIVFLPNTNDQQILEEKAKKILDGVEEIIIQSDPEYKVELCIGIAIYPKDGGSYEELFKNADQAMYKIKKNGKNGYSFFEK